MAVNFCSPSRQPLTTALLVLLLIWTVALLRTHHPATSPTRAGASASEEVKDAWDRKPNDVTQPAPPKASHSKVSSAIKADVTSSPISPVANPGASSSDRPLILYAYADTDSARRNLAFFLAHGVHDAADFIFILNGESKVRELLPNRTNVHVVQRPNDCYDLGAYAEVLTKNDLYKKYKRFIMLNASIRGPFLPTWAQGCWSNMYLNKVTEKVKLVGMTGNCWPHFHVQSMIWATDSVGLKELLFPPQPTTTSLLPADATGTPPPPPSPVVGINSCFHDWNTAVHAEISASQLIIDAGYKVDVMMTAFHGAKDDDYIGHCDPSMNGDVLWQGKYHGTNVHPYETIFLKTNRDIDPVLMDKLTEWHDSTNYSSYDYCT